MSARGAAYGCSGRNMPEDEYVWCYRAGHRCPPYVAERTEGDTHITIQYRCPCCGQGGTTVCTSREWGEPPIVPEFIRAGLVLDALQDDAS